jgi:hypothetical protein
MARAARWPAWCRLLFDLGRHTIYHRAWIVDVEPSVWCPRCALPSAFAWHAVIEDRRGSATVEMITVHGCPDCDWATRP